MDNTTMTARKNKKKAFTLVEILVVIAVIGILFTVFIPKIDFASDKAKETGVKSDLRSYILSAEQVMREHSGLGFVGSSSQLKDVVAQLNLYLDDTMDFTDAGKSDMDDPWNQPYEVHVAATAGTNNGKILFETGGKNQAIDGINDYAALVTYKDGVIRSATAGFSSNIGAILESSSGSEIDITNEGATTGTAANSKLTTSDDSGLVVEE